MQRLHNDKLARLLHAPLYERMLAFAHEYTPEFPGEVVVAMWLNQLYNNDDNLHILVSLSDNYDITAHCVIIINEAYGYKTVICHQLQDNAKAKLFHDECIEYLNKLRDHVGAVCSMFTVTKNVKAYEKKYDYKVARTVMIQYGLVKE